MAEPRSFPRALNIAYGLMTAVLVAIASVGYWYWGNLAHVLVTRDFELHSPYSRVELLPHVGIQLAVQALVVLNVATTLPLLLLSFQDLVHSFWVTSHLANDVPQHFMVRLPSHDARWHMCILNRPNIVCPCNTSRPM